MSTEEIAEQVERLVVRAESMAGDIGDIQLLMGAIAERLKASDDETANITDAVLCVATQLGRIADAINYRTEMMGART